MLDCRSMIGEVIYAHNRIYINDFLEEEHRVENPILDSDIWIDVDFSGEDEANYIHQHVDGSRLADEARCFIKIPY